MPRVKLPLRIRRLGGEGTCRVGGEGACRVGSGARGDLVGGGGVESGGGIVSIRGESTAGFRDGGAAASFVDFRPRLPRRRGILRSGVKRFGGGALWRDFWGGFWLVCASSSSSSFSSFFRSFSSMKVETRVPEDGRRGSSSSSSSSFAARFSDWASMASARAMVA